MPSATSSSPEIRAAEAFREHCRDTNEARVAIVARLTLGIILAVGPIEYQLLSGRPETAASQLRWIVAAGLFSAIGTVFFFYSTRMRRNADLSVAGGFAVAMVITGAGVSQIGGLETLYVGIAYIVPMIGMMLLVPLRRRIWIALVCPLCFFAALFSLRPEALGHPYIGISFFHSSLSVLFTVIFGHMNYELAREHFEQRQILAGEAERQGEAVRQRTAEVLELARSVVSVEETERTRIARELHDELGQRLTAVRLDAGSTASEVRGELGHDSEIARRVAAIEAGIATAQSTVREVVHSLRPPALDDVELATALELLVERYQQPDGIELDYENELGDDELSDTQATTIYRVLQEALTNVVRHSGAHTVRVRLRPSGAWVELVVTDDGTGVPDDRMAGGFGLRGMRERLRLVNGEFRLSPAPGGGTIATARFPLATRTPETAPRSDA